MKLQCNECGWSGNVDTKTPSQEVCEYCHRQGSLSHCVEPKPLRELKFRAWDNYYFKMVQSIVCEAFELGVSFEGVVIGFEQENTTKDKPASVGIFPARFTPMQFTGLKDKKGKEIYEKDRVIIETTGLNYRADKIKGTVEFIDGCFTVVFDEPVYDKTLGCMRRNLYVKCFVVNYAIEVIGNIYTNKEV